MKAPRIQSKISPLLRYVESNLWIRARGVAFQAHLRNAAIHRIARKGGWFFKVSTDADLMTAWLSTTVLQGGEILDPDVVERHSISLQTRTLVDLILPPDLLILHLGVKSAANKEMPGVLQEALSTRYHEDKPTWIWDQPHSPLEPGHRCYSDALIDSLEIWNYVGPLTLGSQATATPRPGIYEIPQEDEEEGLQEEDEKISEPPKVETAAAAPTKPAQSSTLPLNKVETKGKPKSKPKSKRKAR